MAITLENFLKNDSSVKAAKKKLTAATAELNKQKAALSAASGRLSADQKATIQKRINVAQIDFNKAQAEAAKVEATRTDYFNANQKTIQAKATATDVQKAKQELEEVLALKQNNPGSVVLDARIQDLNSRINQTGKYAPKVEVKTQKGQVVGADEAKPGPRDYVGEINSAAVRLRNLPEAERANLALVLKNAGFYTGPIVGVYTDAVATAWQTAIATNQARSTQWGEEVPWGIFIQEKINETNALKTGTGVGKVTGTVSISTPSEAAAKVTATFQRELKRLPTAEELSFYSDKLIKEESKKSSITKATPKKVGGVIVTEYTGGLDRDQFLSEMVRKLPEYNRAKAAADSLTIQDLAKTAAANGLDLNKNFGQSTVNGWAKRVANGEDVDIFKNIIRQTASVGLPDNVVKLMQSGVDLETVYAPYKRTMASILELPENAIDFNDPTLRRAIGPDKPTNLYDFEKSLKKDPRWQYTSNAREEVSNIALSVLRDFGFQG